MKKLLTLMIGVLLTSISIAGNVTVPANTNYLVATTAPYNTLTAGDTLFFTAGHYDYISLMNFTMGTLAHPIVVTPKGGEVIINTTFAYGFRTWGCKYLKITGGYQNYQMTGNFAVDTAHCGFQIRGVTNGADMSCDGLSEYVEIDHCYLAYSFIAGLYYKTDPDCTGMGQRQNWTQHNSWVHDNVFDHCGDEGMYVGSSKYTGEDTQCSGVTIYPADLWNCQIYRNMSWYAGYDGIQVACARKGSSIHDNKVFYAGQKDLNTQCTGYIIGGGDSCDVYNNYAYKCKEDSYDVMLSAGNFYNNEAWYSGYGGSATNSDGIFEKDVATVPGTSFGFYNNLVVGAKTVGILMQTALSANNMVENNIILNVTSGTYTQFYNPNVITHNNFTGTSASLAQFTDTLGNFQASSPLKDAGYPVSYMSTDFFGNPRVVGSTIDIGPVEYQSGGGGGTAPSTPGNIAGTTTQCSTNTGQGYSISSVSGATSYTWTVPSGWILMSGQGTISITTNIGSSSGNISVVANNTYGTSNASVLAVTVSSIPATPASITGTTTQTASTTSTYSITAVSGATTYTWSVPTGWTLNSGQGTTSVSITSGAAGQNGNISVTAGNSCGTSSAMTLAVTVTGVAPTAPTSMTGDNNPCPKVTGLTYSVSAVPTATKYTWAVPTGWVITKGQNSTIITVTSGAYKQNGNITVKASNAYGSSALLYYPVIVNPCTCKCPHN